jgi:hypothetical protein
VVDVGCGTTNSMSLASPVIRETLQNAVSQVDQSRYRLRGTILTVHSEAVFGENPYVT